MNPYTDDRSVWFRVFVLLVVSVAAPLNQFKVPPILPFLMDAFNLSVSKAGLLMSLFATTGLILALPAGFIFQKLGYRVTGLLAVGSIIVGALMGAMSTSAGMILSSRVIEGIGMSFMTVVPRLLSPCGLRQTNGARLWGSGPSGSPLARLSCFLRHHRWLPIGTGKVSGG
jgi:predicted MFS family arabinose efflux permease